MVKVFAFWPGRYKIVIGFFADARKNVGNCRPAELWIALLLYDALVRMENLKKVEG
ncbi:hypothetical protein [Dyadobacter crusticola]|uniref:hypothetical protein n=1 Tax=Dyadobacter crusticola TaxID=292407 RepID=UPI0012F8E1FD|nr:hypothetical protein [Dyadobacter crusticola]